MNKMNPRFYSKSVAPIVLLLAKSVALIVPLLAIGCTPPAPIGVKTQAISGGVSHEGHLSVGRLQVGGEFICGGILVGVRTALTSAHCVSEEPMVLVLDSGQTIAIDEAVRHPDFTSEQIFADMYRGYFDVAVLRLAVDAPITAAVVNGQTPTRGTEITLVGFGATYCEVIDAGVDGAPPLSCQYNVPGKQIATNTIEQVYGHEFSIAGEANACKGDSGGAVLGIADGREVVIGIPAHAEMPCGVRSYASRLDAFVPWLLEVSEGDINIYQPAKGDGGSRGDGGSSSDEGGDAGDNCSRWGVCGSATERNLKEGCGCRIAEGPKASLLWLIALTIFIITRRGFFSVRRGK